MTILPSSWFQTNKNDWFLLILVGGCLLSSGLLFYLTGIDPSAVFFKVAVLLFCAFAIAHRFTRKTVPAEYRWFFPGVAMLLSVGMILIFRLAPDHAMHHLTAIIIGLALFQVTSILDYRIYRKFFWHFGVAGLLLLTLTAAFGQRVYGAKNWISFLGLSWQPSELVKVFLVLFFAGIMCENRRHFWGYVFWGLAILLLVVQKDLGTAAIYYGTWIAMKYVSGAKSKNLILSSALGLLAAAGAFYLFPHFRERFLVWLNPWQDPSGSGYQIIQALYAYRAGGLVGTGLGLGQPQLIPAVITDFIFAALGEETGLAGALAVLLCFLFLVIKVFQMAVQAADPFGAYVAVGFAVLVGLEVLVIVGGVTKLIPLTGITLPFVSFGGSSLVSSMVMMGLLVNIVSRSALGEKT